MYVIFLYRSGCKKIWQNNKYNYSKKKKFSFEQPSYILIISNNNHCIQNHTIKLFKLILLKKFDPDKRQGYHRVRLKYIHSYKKDRKNTIFNSK